MTNQEAFEAARAGDWIAESFTRSGDVFTLGGKSAGYSSFADCLDDGQSIFYAAFDEDDNREAGLAIWDAAAKTLTPVEIHATLVGGAFIKGDPDPLQFTKGGTITGTFNATGFNTIWRHVFEKGNPHETQADEIDQSNDELGDTVQDALNRIGAILQQLDPDGNTDIDWGDIDGLKDVLNSKADKTALDQEILDRIAGDEALQAQIDAIDPNANSDIDWSDIENKPATFPPSAHTHQIDDVSGLQDALDTLEGSISGGGGFVEAPSDGKLYGRKNAAWDEVVIPEQTDPTWDSITGKPSEFPPSSHNHTWDQVTGKPTEFPPAAHNHDGVYQPVGNYITEAPNDGKQYVRESEDWAEVSIPEAGGAVQIGATFDGTPAEGDQWLETPAGEEAVMWVYDGEKWLQMPGGGGSGQDGITTATLPLANPTREATGLSTQSDANNYFAEAIAKVVNEDGDVALTDYYTKTESDAAYQPKGDYLTTADAGNTYQPKGSYIEDAPSNGDLYVRKDGAWEKFEPSSGGGGGLLVKAVTQPATAGDFQFTTRGSGGSVIFHGGTYAVEQNSIKATMNVPPGFAFIFQNCTISGGNKQIPFEGIKIDGVQLYEGGDIAGKYHTVDKDAPFFVHDVYYTAESSVEINTKSQSTTYFHIFGYFIAADGTRASEVLREEYLAEEAERLALMPSTQEVTDE